MNTQEASALLQSAQSLRQHWSGVQSSLINYATIVNVGIWTYLLIQYMKPEYEIIHIMIAATISSVTLVIWRVYTHYVNDDHISVLYPELVYYESVLHGDSDYGTMGYLKKSPLSGIITKPEGHTFITIFSESDANQRAKAIKYLVNKKCLGLRGHLPSDIITFIVIGTTFMFLLSNLFGIIPIQSVIYREFGIQLEDSIGKGPFIIVSIFLGLYIWRFTKCFQHSPSVDDIKKATEELASAANH